MCHSSAGGKATGAGTSPGVDWRPRVRGDAEGTIVWSYINRYDADRVLTVNAATRYPESW
jgi:hypothetical protein